MAVFRCLLLLGGAVAFCGASGDDTLQMIQTDGFAHGLHDRQQKKQGSPWDTVKAWFSGTPASDAGHTRESGAQMLGKAQQEVTNNASMEATTDANAADGAASATMTAEQQKEELAKREKRQRLQRREHELELAAHKRVVEKEMKAKSQLEARLKEAESSISKTEAEDHSDHDENQRLQQELNEALAIGIISESASKDGAAALHNTSEAIKAKAACDFGLNTWGLFVDGSMATKGKRAFGGIYTDNMLQGLASHPFDEGASKELDVEAVEEIYKTVCPAASQATDPSDAHQTPVLATFRDGAGLVAGNAAAYRFGMTRQALAVCTKAMPNATVKQELVKDLPADLLDISYAASPKSSHATKKAIESISTKVLVAGIAKTNLRLLLDRYHASVRSASERAQKDKDEEALQGKKLWALALLMRSLAWLHPFQQCNARVRTVLLQRELRHLQLGCGAMMYSNGPDLFFSTTAVYARKIVEGLKMAMLANQTGENPWLQEEHIQEHQTRFPSTVEGKCAAAFRDAAASNEERQRGFVDI
jgi:hypothetical protein